ncbi:MAG: hypothetical protein AAB360_04395 [Patescibacteria group bacterium]
MSGKKVILWAVAVFLLLFTLGVLSTYPFFTRCGKAKCIRVDFWQRNVYVGESSN